jgi:diacylglycerol kinase (ATP)
MTALKLDQEVAKELKIRKGFIASFIYAFDGLLRTLLTQRNMKVHWVSGLAVMLVGMALELDVAARASVMFCVFVVLCMEVLNTGLEAFVDLHIKQYARTAMIAKDAAAAAVLVLAFAAVVVFADILFHNWRMVMNSGDAIVRTVTFGLPLLGLTAMILWMRRVMAVIFLLLFSAIGLLSALAWYSRDEVFSSCALGFVLTAAWSRVREPRLIAVE